MTAIRLAYGALRILAHAAVEFARPHRCVHCLQRFHSIQAYATHLWVDHYGEPAPKKEHAR